MEQPSSRLSACNLFTRLEKHAIVLMKYTDINDSKMPLHSVAWDDPLIN